MCTVFVKGWYLKWCSLLALLIFHSNVVICFNKYFVFPVWVVSPFCADPEAIVEFGSMEHGQLIVTTFTQLFLMCSFAILLQKPGIVWNEKSKLEENLVSEFLNVTVYIIHLHFSYLTEYPSFSESSMYQLPFLKICSCCCSVSSFSSCPHSPCPVVTLVQLFVTSVLKTLFLALST